MKFLIVDDEALIRKALLMAAKKAGHEVREAGNGKEALKVLESFTPDLAFVDILMPEMDGLEFLKEVKPGLKAKIILISAHDELDEQELKNKGADLFIRKPFPNVFELIKRAEDLILKECESSLEI